MKKKELSSEEIYKKNQKKSKVLRIIAPLCFWGFLAVSIVCLFFAIKNSFGNIAEIVNMLDKKQLTGEELSNNYKYLIDKYGEWIIGTGGNGFSITFVNIGKALVNGVMITNLVCSGAFFCSAYVLGKWVMPKIAAQILIDNQDMVNLTILKNK